MPTADTIQTAQPFYMWDTVYQLPVESEVNTGIPLDSIFPPREVQPPAVRRSLFTHTTLPVTHDGLQARKDGTPAPWLFAILVLICASIIIYYKSHKLRIIDLLRGATDRRAMERLLRGNNLSSTSLVPMGLLTIASLGTSIFLMAMSHTGIIGWLLLVAGLTVAYLLRNGIIAFLGNVFEDGDATSAYIGSNYLYHMLLATATAPLLLFQAYTPGGGEAFFYVVAGLTALCLVTRLFRGLKLFLTLSRSRSFYLFYYLCIVETIPFLVLIKWFFAQ